METAIKLAIEGGWEDRQFGFDCEIDTWQHTTSDPIFWQCLGKALGWKQPIIQYAYIDENLRTTSLTVRWQNEMHRFIDHLADGKTPDEFFTNLTNNHDTR